MIVHLSPASMAAVITRMKPTRSNWVSPATSSSSPPVMTVTTPASPQLGFSMPHAMAKMSRKMGVVDLHMT